jgi:hypothetical protein
VETAVVFDSCAVSSAAKRRSWKRSHTNVKAILFSSCHLLSLASHTCIAVSIHYSELTQKVHRMTKPLLTAVLLGRGLALGMAASLRRVFRVIWRCVVKKINNCYLVDTE